MTAAETTREALTAAAAGLFWKQGYAGTSIADIAREAGVPTGNVYYHFKTKVDFARAVAGMFVAETGEMLAVIEQAQAEPRARLTALVERLRQTQRARLEGGCPIARACQDFRSAAPDAATLAGESFALITGFIGRELGRTGLRPSLALARGRAFVAEWQGGIALAFALGDATVLAESARRMEITLFAK